MRCECLSVTRLYFRTMSRLIFSFSASSGLLIRVDPDSLISSLYKIAKGMVKALPEGRCSRELEDLVLED